MNDKSSDEKLQKLITIARQYTEQVVQFNKQIKRLEQLINLKSLNLLLPASKKEKNNQNKKQLRLEKDHKEENMAEPSSGIRYASNFHNIWMDLLNQQQESDYSSENENKDQSMKLS